jgi:hypothetical protein
MENQNQNQNAKTSKTKVIAFGKKALAVTGVALVTIAPAFAAEDASNQIIDLTTAVTGVAILGGLMAAGGLKAVPTYAGWGIKKALAMLR